MREIPTEGALLLEVMAVAVAVVVVVVVAVKAGWCTRVWWRRLQASVVTAAVMKA